MGEVGKAAAAQGMTRAEAEPIILRLVDEYKHVFAKGNEGLPFEEVYDEDGNPRDFWLAMYEEVRAELADLGLKL